MTTTAGPNLNTRSMTETLAEADLYFMGQGALNNTLTQLAEDLKSRGIEKLIELKLASGMTAPDRLKDLDVQELIKLRALPDGLAERLDPYVRQQFLELADAVKGHEHD